MSAKHMNLESAIQHYVAGNSIAEAAAKYSVARTTLARRLHEKNGLIRKYTKRIQQLPTENSGSLRAVEILNDDKGRIVYRCVCD